MATSSASGPLWPLVKAMQLLPCLASQHDRNFVVRLLMDRLGPLQIDENPRIGPHLLSIVEACARRSDGLEALLDILGELDEGTPHLQEVARLIAERDVHELWPEEERERLFALLSGMIFQDLVELYRQVAGTGAPELPAETTYREVFATLESLNSDPAGLPKPIVFVEHLAKDRRPEFANELRKWADRQANRLGVVTELQALRRTMVKPPEKPSPSVPRVVLTKEPSAESGEPDPAESSVAPEPAAVVHTDVDWTTDAPADRDYLNRALLADVLADRIREVRDHDPGTSFLMHIDGAWGVGKSSLLNFLDSRLADEFTIIRFDAWRQARLSPPWWALLSATRRGTTRDRNIFAAGWLRFREAVARARRTGAPYVLAVLLLLVLVGVAAVFAWPHLSNGRVMENAIKVVTSALAVAGIVWTGALVAGRFLLWDSARGARLFEQSTANPMDDVAQHFDWTLRQARKPVLFLIDDLDRCPAPYVVELLDSVQTLIRDIPIGAHTDPLKRGACYFVVAADGAWLRHSYETAYGSFGESMSEPGYPLGFRFLDKLFQLTVPVPAPTKTAQSGYLDSLLRITGSPADHNHRNQVEGLKTEIARATGDEESIMRTLDQASASVREDLVADAVRALAAPATRERTEHALRRYLPLLQANPRNVKKFLNTYSMLRAIRVLENNTIASDAIALWTIILVRWPAMALALEAAPEAVRGIVDPLWAAECFPAELCALAADPALRRTVLSPMGGPLTPNLIRRCCGTDSIMTLQDRNYN